MRRVLWADPDVARRLNMMDLAPGPMPPAEFAAAIVDDLARRGPIIRSTGCRLGD